MNEKQINEMLVASKWYYILSVLHFLSEQNRQRRKNAIKFGDFLGTSRNWKQVNLFKVFITWFTDRRKIIILLDHETEPHL